MTALLARFCRSRTTPLALLAGATLVAAVAFDATALATVVFPGVWVALSGASGRRCIAPRIRG